jgi:hypothetical protein|tara:strand:- start:869 stop:1084 length:216 start_codon:yes stop_codon:yes gene_type:complete
MEKNRFKLPEEIGKGINQDHLDKVIKERNKDFTISFKIENHINKQLEDKCEEMEVPKSFLLQYLVKNFLKG